MSDDNWKNRTHNMRCVTCVYFVPKASSKIKEGELFKVGRCRRHAPTMSGFPVVFLTDWCGDHKLHEDAV